MRQSYPVTITHSVGTSLHKRGSLLYFTCLYYYPRTMVRQLRLEYEGALYHITARGNAQAAIYLDDEDRTGFLGVLRTPQRYLACRLLVYLLYNA
jgi:hypothetical protein